MIVGREDVRAFTFAADGTGGGAYWRDVGTLDAYYRASMDLLADAPGLDLYDRAWPVYSFQPSFPPPRVSVTREPPGKPQGSSRRNIFANGTIAEGWLQGAVVGFDCRVEEGALVEDSVLFDGVSVGSGAEVRRAIVDKRVRVAPGARVGVDPDEDRRRGFVVSEAGITCVPKGTAIDS
jgi:glucose-1-phosphate adenylyltransferase